MYPRKIEVLREDIEIAVVPLGKNGEHGNAYLNLEDYRRLMRNGLSGNWSRLPNGYVVAPSRNVKGHNVIVARVLLNLGEMESVTYTDGDRTNLRRNNLQVNINRRGKQSSEAALAYDPFDRAIKPFGKDGRAKPHKEPDPND